MYHAHGLLLAGARSGRSVRFASRPLPTRYRHGSRAPPVTRPAQGDNAGAAERTVPSMRRRSTVSRDPTWQLRDSPSVRSRPTCSSRACSPLAISRTFRMRVRAWHRVCTRAPPDESDATERSRDAQAEESKAMRLTVHMGWQIEPRSYEADSDCWWPRALVSIFEGGRLCTHDVRALLSVTFDTA